MKTKRPPSLASLLGKAGCVREAVRMLLPARIQRACQRSWFPDVAACVDRRNASDGLRTVREQPCRAEPPRAIHLARTHRCAAHTPGRSAPPPARQRRPTESTDPLTSRGAVGQHPRSICQQTLKSLAHSWWANGVEERHPTGMSPLDARRRPIASTSG